MNAHLVQKVSANQQHMLRAVLPPPFLSSLALFTHTLNVAQEAYAMLKVGTHTCLTHAPMTHAPSD